MATTATTYGGYPKQDAGDNLNTWGTDTTAGVNNAIERISEGIHGVVTHTVTGDFTLTSTNYASQQNRQPGHILAGSPSAAFTMTVASVKDIFLVHNKSGKTATIKTSGGSTTVTLEDGHGATVVCDATSCFETSPINLDDLGAPGAAVALGSQKITGLATGTDSGDAVNVGQMNTAISSAGIPASSGAVLISANDTTARFLNGALVAGTNITLTENNNGSDKTLTVAAPTVVTTGLSTMMLLGTI